MYAFYTVSFTERRFVLYDGAEGACLGGLVQGLFRRWDRCGLATIITDEFRHRKVSTGQYE